MLITSYPVVMPSIAITVACLSVCMYVCLSVCLCVRPLISKITSTNSTKSSEHVACDRGSVLIWRQSNRLCASGFVDAVMFLHNRTNRPEPKTTLMFRTVYLVAAPAPAAQGPTSAVSDCILLQNAVLVLSVSLTFFPIGYYSTSYVLTCIILLY